MLRQSVLPTVVLCALCCAASAQVLTFPQNTSSRFTSAVALDAIQTGQMDFNFFTINGQNGGTTPLQTPSGSVSALDLKAPGRAQREYEKGYQMLLRKDAQGAIPHLAKAIKLYAKYVAAHNALGSAYLRLGENEQAREEFEKAVALDDHMANSYLNVGCVELALKQYSAAEAAFRKASEIAPMDLEVTKALAYAAYVNRDYPVVLATVREVHERKHRGAAIVHYFAAAAYEAQNDLLDAQSQMETLLQEDPNSGSAAEFRLILEGIKQEKARRAEAKLHPVQEVKFSFSTPAEPTAEEASGQAQQVLQNVKERSQIAEAEAEPEPVCTECGKTAPIELAANSGLGVERSRLNRTGTMFRSSVDEVAIFFAATDRGRSVTDLTAADIGVSDDSRAPERIVQFRNQTQLPLRLGLVIDASNSVTERFSFEQNAATKFLERVLTDKSDLGFVVGVNNSVLMVQDFTSDQMLMSRAIYQLAPAGGTALWDAIAFASAKLAKRAEEQPVARVLVVISDGQDNSSSMTLKEAIASAQRGEVAVYTVSTREALQEDANTIVGDHALRTLSELTGGAAFVPGSVQRLNGSLADVQEVIRSRYLVSYKPAAFRRDGRYRAINITAEKDGRKLRVYARKGYYASAVQVTSADQ
ncbi:MAG TPA: VWA domain-containing protein [Candidatus Sulfotelmatobacter sp.]|nr:VWA domain-containing protein [Candidatus Sulfotelmatobacter sp.]